MFLSYQIDYLLWLQNLRSITDDFFTPFFLAVTHFGEPFIPLLFVALIYWSLNRKTGEFLLLNLSFCLIFNQLLKMVCCINRPWILSDKIKPVPDAIPNASGYSFPSGHTACATAVWGGLAFELRKNKAALFALIGLILLIAFSRNYLGVHTLQDVLVSLILGILIIPVVSFLFVKMEENKNFDTKVFLWGIFLSLSVLLFVLFKPNVESNEEIAIAAKTTHMQDFLFYMGSIIGTFLGWYLCRKFVPFTTFNISIAKRIFRFLLGITILLPIIFLTYNTFLSDFGENKGIFLYGMFVMSYVTLLYPWIFSKIENFFDIDVLEKLWFWKKN